MANTNAPTVATYNTVKVPLAGENTSRSPYYKKDRRTVNMLPEAVASGLTGEKDITLKKRSGTNLIINLPAGEGRGVANFGADYFAVIDNIVYKNSVPFITLATSTGSVGFTVLNGLSGLANLIILDGINGFVITPGGGYTVISDGDFPSPHLPFPVAMDGYLIVAAGNGSQQIHNSAINDPFTWTPGDYIDAEMYPDYITALVRIKNYFVAFSTGSLEFFFNPGTIVSGSPFQRNDSAAKKIGTLRPGSLAVVEDQVTFVGTSDADGETVFLLDGFNISEIADITVKRSIEYATRFLNTRINAFNIREDGHKYYVLHLYGYGAAPTDPIYQVTWVYEYTTKWWGEWTYGDLNTKFPFEYITYNSTSRPVLQNKLNGSLYNLGNDIYQDNALPITTRIQTSKLDFDNIRYKDHNRLSFYMDQGSTTDSNSVPVNMNISWSDDDYSTWTTRTVLMTDNYTSTAKLGKARRRAYRFDVTANTTYRIESIEIDINTMTT